MVVDVAVHGVDVGALVVTWGRVIVFGNKIGVVLDPFSSQHPQNLPGVAHVVVAGALVVVRVRVGVVVASTDVVLSLQPNQPGVLQVEVEME